MFDTGRTESRKRVLVADDEPLARRGVRQLLAPHSDFIVAGESRNGRETLAALDTLAPNLLFLDVRMPEMDGFEVFRARRPERMPAVVFVTAYDEFAVRAFEEQAVDYLVKPLNVQRFDTALQRVRQHLQMREAFERATGVPAFLAGVQAENKLGFIERLVVHTANAELVIPVVDIDWISAEDYYCRLHMGSKHFLLRESLSSLTNRFDSRRFARVHRSAIVQLDCVRELRNTLDGQEVVLQSGSRVPVSRRRRSMLENLLRYKFGLVECER